MALQTDAERQARRDAAIKAFWSDHPLNVTFRNEVGESFTLKQFIAFVIVMPGERFAACTARVQ